MTHIPNADLLEATRLINAGRLTDATATLQRMLGGGVAAPNAAARDTTTSDARRAPPTLEGVAEPVGMAPAQPVPQPGPAARGASRRPFSLAAAAGPALPETLRDLLGQVSQGGVAVPGGRLGGLAPAAVPDPVPDGAQFLTASFSNKAGSRPYKLYVPSGYRPGQPVPLIVMLHGCTQYKQRRQIVPLNRC